MFMYAALLFIFFLLRARAIRRTMILCIRIVLLCFVFIAYVRCCSDAMRVYVRTYDIL
jgi:hypothetical protein